jgi:2-iminobutanoate/2-iminopropanoate deaminase
VTRQAINTKAAPTPVGPYSQSVAAHGLLFIAGQMGIDPKTGKLAEGGVEAEARQALDNLKAISSAAGSTMADILKTTIFLLDFDDFAKVNAIYATYFDGAPPARSTVEVGRLPMGAKVEIEAVSLAPSGNREPSARS